MREPGDLDRGRVGVGGVGVGHRLDDDRMGRPDEDAADVDADGRRAAAAAGRPVELIERSRPAAEPAGDVEAVIQIRNANRNTNPTM